jgi:hypothetical protein
MKPIILISNSMKRPLELTVLVTVLSLSPVGSVAFAKTAMPLVVLSGVDESSLSTAHASVSFLRDTLSVRGDDPKFQATLQFNLPAPMRDLSKWGVIEIDLENTGDRPLRFSFWALSGNGWGGVSTWSTRPEMKQPPEAGGPKAAGFEVLAPKQRGTFQIDLHACYPKPDAATGFYTAAINPASVRWLRLVLGDTHTVPSARLHHITVSGSTPAESREHFKRAVVPDIARGQPAAGKRVYQKLPGWENTQMEHVLSLPKEWKPGAKFPVIVEYTGNIFYHMWCHSTGLTEQGNMAYGLSRGETFILLNLPFVSLDGQEEEPNDWGSIEKTEDYCLQALQFVSEQYGADMSKVFFTGFSRGQLAMNYLALRDEGIAPIWRGFIGADPAIASARKWGGSSGWNNCAIGWDERGARLEGRPIFSQHPNYGIVHVDVDYLEDSPSTVKTRAWLREMIEPSNQ